LSHSCQLGRKKCEYIIPMLNKELIESYKATTYFVSSLNLHIRIDEKNPMLELTLKNQGAKTWAFITAWNPKSRELSLAENQTRNQNLLAQLKSQGFSTYEGIGIPDDGDWTPEESLFIPCISRQYATELGIQYGQNAIVFGEVGKIAELVVISLGMNQESSRSTN